MANKKIIDLVYAKSDSMQNNPAEAGQNATLAIAAIKGGIRSPEWRAYMMQFVEQDVPGIPVDPRQLDRLLGVDETRDLPEMDRKRAYLVGNAPCADFTPTGLGVRVDSIDEGIASDCEPAGPVPLPAKNAWKPMPPKKAAAKKPAAKKPTPKKK